MLFELVILYLVSVIASGSALLVDSYKNGHTKGEFTVLFTLSLVPVVNMVIMLISITSILHPLEKDVDKHIQRWL